MSNNSHQQLETFGLNSINISEVSSSNNLDNHSPGILHGGRYWEASFHLMAFLSDLPIKESLNIIDVGCGRGLSSVFCAKHFQSNVTAVDADPEVHPFIKTLAEANACEVSFLNINFKEIDTRLLAQYNMFIASDICFWDEMSEQLIQLVEKAINAGVETIIISDPGRPPFLEAAEHCVEKFYGEIIESSLGNEQHDQAYILYIENA